MSSSKAAVPSWTSVQHMLLWKNFPLLLSCQLWEKEWALNTGKLPAGLRLAQEQCGEVTDHPDMTSVVYCGH